MNLVLTSKMQCPVGCLNLPTIMFLQLLSLEDQKVQALPFETITIHGDDDDNDEEEKKEEMPEGEMILA